ncbi:hypothetical protein [Endozoicomonas sp. SESOKO3]|uniref:hypothetical protein n=1 Tax=Endozoicomonas sp. SESOKO3 TaxID=2828744 RepID=UPI002149568F|nr:hypothetical protein [Endozoicomonas sp. SESOKO3]
MCSEMTRSMNSVFLAWQDPKERNWHTVGKLSRDQELFIFDYTLGGQERILHPLFRDGTA